jgi:cardiolipin synthase A/B
VRHGLRYAMLAAALASCSWLPGHELPYALDSSAPAAQPRGSSTKTVTEARAVAAALRPAPGATLLDRHLATMAEVSTVPLVKGNDVRLLIDGPATFAAMFAAIERARSSVQLQTYIFEADELGEKMAALLRRKQRQGVEVSVLYDSIGSLGTPAAFFERLREDGVRVCEFNPVNPLKGKGVTLNHRDHRKILVVDGAVAFTGGINVSSVYSRGSASRARAPADEKERKKSGWRDTQIEVRGPAVGEFQRLFADSWGKQSCPAAHRLDAAKPPARGDKVVRVIGSTPDESRNLIYIELLSAIDHAESSVYITMAYFVPDRQTLDALTNAARRGVDVRLILPGFSDFSVVFHAGRSHYRRLLEAGVRIFERRDALLHAKTVVIDGVWSMVGSANMDWRSFVHNDEVNAVVLGSGFAAEMKAMFDRDLAAATPVTLEQWAHRGLATRLQELWARAWEYWL